ncbi:MAG TPA: CAP domain-containing protein, partial [Longimicrobiales bacterium]
RRQAGAGGLVVVEGMNAAAQAHAEHLRGRHELDHTSWIAGRKDPAARLDAEGVKWTRVGENLAQLSDRAGIPDATIQIWMNSPGHRHNLLDPQFNVTGVGVARDERGTYYIVQMYATQ